MIEDPLCTDRGPTAATSQMILRGACRELTVDSRRIHRGLTQDSLRMSRGPQEGSKRTHRELIEDLHRTQRGLTQDPQRTPAELTEASQKSSDSIGGTEDPTSTHRAQDSQRTHKVPTGLREWFQRVTHTLLRF